MKSCEDPPSTCQGFNGGGTPSKRNTIWMPKSGRVINITRGGGTTMQRQGVSDHAKERLFRLPCAFSCFWGVWKPKKEPPQGFSFFLIFFLSHRAWTHFFFFFQKRVFPQKNDFFHGIFVLGARKRVFRTKMD